MMILKRIGFLSQSSFFLRSLSFTGAYIFWIISFRLVSLTFFTYFLISPTSRFQDISDTVSSNEVSLMGLAAILFVGFSRWFFPMRARGAEDFISQERIEKKFFPGFFQGAVFAALLVMVFLLTDIYKYLGYFIQFEEAPLALANVFLRMLALASLAYCEEWIFHHKLTEYLSNKDNLWAILWTSALFCIVKKVQFDLGIAQTATLFLLSSALYLRALREKDFAWSGGFWTAVLIIFHPLLSLPVFGNDFSGVLLVKYQPSVPVPFLIRPLSGGVGGPLSSFAFQTVLILDIGRSILKSKNWHLRFGVHERSK